MPRPFSSATAEQVLLVVGAVVSKPGSADVTFVAQFCDLLDDQAENALDLSVDLGFLSKKSAKYEIASPLCKFLRTPNSKQKAAVLRTMLESYEPFEVFRKGIEASGSADTAAQQTRALLDIDAHREDIKGTLANLALYSGALIAGSGGAYEIDPVPLNDVFSALSQGCADIAAAESRIRAELGADVHAIVSYQDVLSPLAAGLRFAVEGDAREAVLNAGNAIDTFLDEYAARQGVPLAGATGINAKLDKLKAGGKMPKKLVFKGKYLGHIRNAADHGNDADIGASWQITKATGQEFVFVACSFIASVFAFEAGTFQV